MLPCALYLCRYFPSSFANLSKMDVFIKDGNAKITANTTLLNSVYFFIVHSFMHVQILL